MPVDAARPSTRLPAALRPHRGKHVAGRLDGPPRRRGRRRPLQLLLPWLLVCAVVATAGAPAARDAEGRLSTVATTSNTDCADPVCLPLAEARAELDAVCVSPVVIITDRSTDRSADDVCVDFADDLDVALARLNAFLGACLSESNAVCATGLDLARSGVAVAVGCVNSMLPPGSFEPVTIGGAPPQGVAVVLDCGAVVRTAADLLAAVAALAIACATEDEPTCRTALQLTRGVVAFTVRCTGDALAELGAGTLTLDDLGGSQPVVVDCAALVRTTTSLVNQLVALAVACVDETEPNCAAAATLARTLAGFVTTCAGDALAALGVQADSGAEGRLLALTFDCGQAVANGVALAQLAVALARSCAEEQHETCAAAAALARRTAETVVGCAVVALHELDIPVVLDGVQAAPVADTLDCGAAVRTVRALIAQIGDLVAACASETDPTCAAALDLGRAVADFAVDCVGDIEAAAGLSVTAFAATNTVDADCGATLDTGRETVAVLVAAVRSCTDETTPACATALELARTIAAFATHCVARIAAESGVVLQLATESALVDVDCGAVVADAKTLVGDVVTIVTSCVARTTPTCATVLQEVDEATALVVGCLVDAAGELVPSLMLDVDAGTMACGAIVADAKARVAALVACVQSGACPGPLPSPTLPPLPTLSPTPTVAPTTVVREPVDLVCVACEIAPAPDVELATTVRRPPGVPTQVRSAARDSAILVEWSPPTSGNVVDDYVVRVYADGQPAAMLSEVAVCSACTDAYVTDLDNGVAYYAEVYAHNLADGYGGAARTAAAIPRAGTLADLPASFVAGAADRVPGFYLGPVAHPSLSEAAKADAVSLMKADPTFSALLTAGGIATYSVATVSPWTTIEAQRSIGAQVRLALPVPLNVHGASIWQYAYDPTEVQPFPHYQQSLIQVDAFNVREVVVLVDLSTRKVAAIQLDSDLDATVLHLGVVIPFPLPLSLIHD